MSTSKIGGQARAMVITSGIERAIQYFYAFRDRTSPNARAPTKRLWLFQASTNMAVAT
jgi:hypothetical protein